jgi:hypothetical protein
MKITRFTPQILLLSMFVWIAGCATPNPLAGWKSLGFEPPDKAITDDYQYYFQQHNMRGYAGPVFYFEDGTGQHAVEFEMFGHIKNVSWQYVLIYDKENKRIKVVKYDRRRYQS